MADEPTTNYERFTCPKCGGSKPSGCSCPQTRPERVAITETESAALSHKIVGYHRDDLCQQRAQKTYADGLREAAEICKARKDEMAQAKNMDKDARLFRHDEAWQLELSIRARLQGYLAVNERGESKANESIRGIQNIS